MDTISLQLYTSEEFATDCKEFFLPSCEQFLNPRLKPMVHATAGKKNISKHV